MSDRDALALSGVSKRFVGSAGSGGETIALDNANLSVRANTIHALLGENGAGKTTLMRIAFGLIRADAGDLILNGKPATLRSPADAIARGLGMVHQHYTNVAAMTVAENIVLGGRGRFDARASGAAVRALGERVGLSVDPDAIVGELSVSAQQRVEILKAVARDAKVLILDEPTAVLAPAESDDLLHWLRGFADGGGAVVLITHKLAEAIEWADDVTVLRGGRTVLTSPRTETTVQAIASAMLGSVEVAKVDATITKDAVGRASGAGDRLEGAGRDPDSAVVVRAKQVTIRDARGLARISDATFDVFAGEIVGVAGVEGAGHHELLRALARRGWIASGTLELPQSVAFVPEDRHREALILDFTLTENVALKGASTHRMLMRWDQRVRATAALMAAHDVRGAPVQARARSLSGGNQQKLALARELDGRPALIVVENPTRGLDIRAAAEVLERLRAARDAGAAIVVYSSDLDELMTLATRVLVVHAGRVAILPADRSSVGAAMLGVA